MKKLKTWQIAAICGLVALFAIRVWFAIEKKNDRADQVKMIRDLSIEQAYYDSSKVMEAILNPELDQLLDSASESLDSIRNSLMERQKKFKEQFNLNDE